VVVCSARSTQTKALGTTNLLLQASREALQPASARPGASGYQTPLYPKRVGSGYFSQSMMSSLSSLKDGERSASPSPFQPSGRGRANTADSGADTPTEWANGNETFEAGFNATVDTIKRGHLAAARQALHRGPLRDELEDEIERDCEALRAFLNAANVSSVWCGGWCGVRVWRADGQLCSVCCSVELCGAVASTMWARRMVRMVSQIHQPASARGRCVAEANTLNTPAGTRYVLLPIWTRCGLDIPVSRDVHCVWSTAYAPAFRWSGVIRHCRRVRNCCHGRAVRKVEGVE
jgi:hypothetical protein